MATLKWIGRAKATAQVDSITPGGTIGTETFTIRVGDSSNGRTVTYTAESGNTAAEVVDGLVAAWNADANPEIAEITAADASTYLTLTADTEGKPFTVTATATGSATLTRAAVTANSSPNDANDGDNYDTGSVPVNSDVVVFENSDIDVLWNLDSLSGVTLTSLRRKASYTGTIGLPAENEAGYPEYRETHLKIGATNIYDEQGDTPQGRQTRLNVGSVQTAYRGTGAGGGTLGQEATELLGTHASNTVVALGASVAVAPDYGDSSTVATLQADNSTVTVGESVTLTTVESRGSLVELHSGCTTLNQRDNNAQTIVHETAAITNTNVYGGTLNWRSSGSPGTVDVFAGASVAFENAPDGVSVTKFVLHNGASLIDPGSRISRSYEIECPDSDVSELADLQLGRDFQITIADVS